MSEMSKRKKRKLTAEEMFENNQWRKWKMIFCGLHYSEMKEAHGEVMKENVEEEGIFVKCLPYHEENNLAENEITKMWKWRKEENDVSPRIEMLREVFTSKKMKNRSKMMFASIEKIDVENNQYRRKCLAKKMKIINILRRKAHLPRNDSHREISIERKKKWKCRSISTEGNVKKKEMISKKCGTSKWRRRKEEKYFTNENEESVAENTWKPPTCRENNRNRKKISTRHLHLSWRKCQ